MISSRSDYEWVGGDIASVTINGGIMPLRSSGTKKVLRGEDVTFLLEGAIDRRSWYNELSYKDSSWTMQTRLNDYAYTGAVNQYPFHRAVSETGTGTIFDAWQLQDPFFSNNSVSGACVFYSATPHANSYSTEITPFTNQPFLTSANRTQTAWGDDVLRQSRVENLFTDLAKPTYASVSVPTSALSLLTTHNEVGTSSYEMSYFGYQANASSYLEDSQGYSTFEKATQQWGAITNYRATNLKMFANISATAYYTTNNWTVEHRDSRYWCEDLTLWSDWSSGTYPTTFTVPELNRDWITAKLDAIGWPIYSAGEDNCCSYAFVFNTVFISANLAPKTTWS